MRRRLALRIGIPAAFLLVALGVSQLVVPPIVASRIEHRLTRDGGSANVSVHAFPALRLLFHDGDSVEVTGRHLRFPLGGGRERVFENLDGFGSAHVHLADVSAGPFSARSFTLDRGGGSGIYSLGLNGSFVPSALASYLGSSVGGPLAGLLGGLAAGVAPGGARPVAVILNARLRSRSGTPELVSGSGSVAGIPVGPLLVAVAVAVVDRL